MRAYIDLRGWNTAVGLTIATAMAATMALFFMRLRFSQALPRLVAGGALL